MSILTTIITMILSNKLVAGLGAGLIAMLGAWLAGRRKGANAERDRQAAATLRNHETREAVEDTVAARTDKEIRKRLGKWSR